MSVVVELCPLCGSTDHHIFERAHDRGRDLTYQLCKACGMVFQSPRMTDEELEKFYLADYRLHVQNEEGPSEKDLSIQSSRASNLSGLIRRHIDEVHAHLDIGCSSGALLSAIKSQYECVSLGVEPGEAYRLYCQQRGLDVVADLADVDAGRHGSFDLITMVHVLEHVPDPVEYIDELRQRWLAPGGYLLVEVPNLFGHPSFELAHLTAFSAYTLRSALQAAGYRPVFQIAHGKPRSRLIPLYLTAIARADGVGSPARVSRTSSLYVKMFHKIGVIWRRLATALLPRYAWLSWKDSSESTRADS